MPLTENGFLGKEIVTYSDHIKKCHEELFSLSKKINKIGHETILNLKVHNNKLQEVLVSTLYVRMLSSFQGIILLVERGMIPQASILMRSFLETIFILCALSKKKKLCGNYIVADHVIRLKSLGNFEKMQKEAPSESERQEIKNLKSKLKAEIEKENRKLLSIAKWAKEAGMYDWYITAYTVLCDSVHTNAKELEDYLIFDKNGAIEGFKFGPTDEGIRMIITTAIEGLTFAQYSVGRLFDLEKDENIDKIHARIREISQLSRQHNNIS